MIHKLFLTMLVTFFCFVSLQAYARLEKGYYSEAEKVGFALYKMGNFKPDFGSWIKQTKKWEEARPRKKMLLMESELTRLSNGLYSYNEAEDFIVFNIDVTATRHLDPEDEAHDDKRAIYLSIYLGEDLLFFPVAVGDMWAAIVPLGLKKLETIYLDEASYNGFIAGAAFHPSREAASVKAKILLRIKSVDTSAPIQLRDEEFWGMRAEIASLSLWNVNATDRHIWSYEAPWYVPPEKQQMLDLYHRN